MKKYLKRLSLVMIATALVFTGCKKDQEDENNGGNGGGTSNAKPECVDLGLPSGTKWATFNVGASQPHEYGNYYAWGETTTKSSYTENNSTTMGQPMSDISGNATYDVATANWGGTWRMPTFEELGELVYDCTWTWTIQNGVKGYTVTGPSGNSIFLPAAGGYDGTSHDYVGERGAYWSSATEESDYSTAGIFAFNSEGHGRGWSDRYVGLTVRPVSD